MAILYGVLRGHPNRYKREDNVSTPHLQIRVLENGGQPWRIAVNVQSDTGSNVAFWVVDPLVGEPVLATLSGLASGFTTAAPNADHALDFVKAPLFDFSLGRALPPTGQANADDLQDLLSLYLDQCKAAGGDCTPSAPNSTRICTSRSTPSSVISTACTAFTTFT
jgi:uncharacterized protein YukJ